MKKATNQKKEELTIGDLIVAVTDAAFETTQDEAQAYEIAGRVLTKLLSTSAPQTAEYLAVACDGNSIH